ncbi:hypothetical protein FE810_03815 [Thalassotalea litorea]|uniref:Uncharacterized protein n=1 Tax=Thalassotalea litorea TaxID=2020715 RepID=A0A5R9ITJ1_9GAMM|nr:hypothetical protein [Thalassotalea litorea]TLU66651.1 hypothetical protein FE810_03815 [Thalassotalea litorea]
MKTLVMISTTLLALVSGSVCAAPGVSEHSAQAGKHSALAVSNAGTASGKAVSGVVAVPLTALGAVGNASGRAGDALMENALTTQPLLITELTVTSSPVVKTEPDPAPNVVININHEQTNGNQE